MLISKEFAIIILEKLKNLLETGVKKVDLVSISFDDFGGLSDGPKLQKLSIKWSEKP